MKSHFTLQILNWIRSQVVGIFIAIIAILVATVYAAPYSPSATGYAKYDVSCTSMSTSDMSNRMIVCVRVDTTTGDSSCKATAPWSINNMIWSECQNG